MVCVPLVFPFIAAVQICLIVYCAVFVFGGVLLADPVLSHESGFYAISYILFFHGVFLSLVWWCGPDRLFAGFVLIFKDSSEDLFIYYAGRNVSVAVNVEGVCFVICVYCIVPSVNASVVSDLPEFVSRLVVFLVAAVAAPAMCEGVVESGEVFLRKLCHGVFPFCLFGCGVVF